MTTEMNRGTDLSEKHLRTYGTRERLVRAIEDRGVAHIRHLIVQTVEGRWTAIFSGHSQDGLAPAHVGFMVFG